MVLHSKCCWLVPSETISTIFRMFTCPGLVPSSMEYVFLVLIQASRYFLLRLSNIHFTTIARKWINAWLTVSRQWCFVVAKNSIQVRCWCEYDTEIFLQDASQLWWQTWDPRKFPKESWTLFSKNQIAVFSSSILKLSPIVYKPRLHKKMSLYTYFYNFVLLFTLISYLFFLYSVNE